MLPGAEHSLSLPTNSVNTQQWLTKDFENRKKQKLLPGAEPSLSLPTNSINGQLLTEDFENRKKQKLLPGAVPTLLFLSPNKESVFDFNYILTVLKDMYVPSSSWGVTKISESNKSYIIFTKWRNLRPERWVVIDDSLNTKVFLDGQEQNASYTVCSIVEITDLLRAVHHYVLCNDINNKEATDCLKLVEPNALGRRKLYCKNCVKRRRKMLDVIRRRAKPSPSKKCPNMYSKLWNEKKKNRCLQNKVTNLRAQVETLRKKCSLSSEAAVQDFINSLPDEQKESVRACLIASKSKNIHDMRYSSKWISHCIQLLRINHNTYEYLRTNKILVLPSITTLRRYIRNQNSTNDFQKTSSECLNEEVSFVDDCEIRGEAQIESVAAVTQIESVAGETLIESSEIQIESGETQIESDETQIEMLLRIANSETVSAFYDEFPSVPYVQTSEREQIKQNHACEFCHKTFRNKSKLQNHVMTHTGERPYVCEVCGKRFIQKWSLNTHSFIHTGEKPYACEVCDKRFNQKSSLVIHTSIHTGYKPHVCNVCGRKFAAKSSLRKHHFIHSNKKPHTCEICQTSFGLQDLLRKHYLTHTGKAQTESVADEAQIESVAAETHLETLLRIANSETVSAFYDELPSVPSENKTKSLKKEQRNHVCEFCFKTFPCKSKLQDHIMTHTGEKPYVCEVCGKRFIQKYALNTHAFIHTGEKPHVCNVCGKRFSLKSTLRKHYSIHSGKKLHTCEICQRSFGQEGLLQKHYLTHTALGPC